MSWAGTVVFFGTGSPRAHQGGATAPGLGTATETGPPPVLGAVWGPYQKGYGEARPTEINNGGDPTGVVTNVAWTSCPSSA